MKVGLENFLLLGKLEKTTGPNEETLPACPFLYSRNFNRTQQPHWRFRNSIWHRVGFTCRTEGGTETLAPVLFCLAISGCYSGHDVVILYIMAWKRMERMVSPSSLQKLGSGKNPKHLSNYSYTTLKPSTFPNIMVLLCWKDRETRPHLGIWHSSNEPRLKYLTRNRETRHFQSQKAQDRGNDSRTTVVSSMFNYCWWKGHFVQLTSEGGISEWFPCPGLFDKVYL